MTQPTDRYFVKAFLILSGFLVFAPQQLRAQQQPATCADWTAIQSWSGTITVSGSGQANDPVNIGTSYTTSVQGTISFTAATNPSGSNNCGFNSFPSWTALNSQAIYSVNMQDVFDTTCTDSKDPFVGHPYEIHYDVSNGSTGFGNAALTMDFGQTTPTYSVGFGLVVDGVVRSSPGVPACNIQPYSITDPQDPWGPGTLQLTPSPTATPLPATVSPLTGSATFQSYDATFGCCANSGQTWTVSWSFTPVLDADVVVKIQGYDTWRPTAGKSETEVVGDPLIVQAQLVQKSTGQPAVGMIPDKWSFRLVNFSSEPGVAMNWPSVNDRASPSPPDLTFNKQINSEVSPNLTITNNDTLAEILNPSQTPAPQNAEVILVPFDWGGWATLNVTATVFGTPIKGHLQLTNGQNVTDILLPKRQPGSHIADIWKSQNNVPLSTPDTDDSETDPNGQPGCVGDGLTLYEEYRGFMENGKHIEGDPNKKDFFIQNLIGADAEPGIALFTSLTQLNVHKDIQKSEMDGLHTDTFPPHEGDRLINFNHGQGAHEVDQHGVVIRTCRYDQNGNTLLGGDTGFSVKGVHGRPGITVESCIQPRDAVGTLSLNPLEQHRGLITAEDAFIQYDVGVAHELLHTVGVEHHGDLDYLLFFSLLTPGNPTNPTGQPVFQKQGGQIVRLLPEEGGPDVATSFWQKVQAEYSRCQTITANPSAYAQDLVAQCALGISLVDHYVLAFYVGLPGGKYSGNDQCVMRYFWANAYPSIADSTTYYKVQNGTEPVGSTICNSLAGTGVNDPNRNLPKDHPQPRYFDATRGDCQHQVCVNDKNAPAKD